MCRHFGPIPRGRERLESMILRRLLHASDLHLTGLLPACRRDPDWLWTQAQALQFLVDQANAAKVPLVLTGDIFDKSVVRTDVLNMAVGILLGAIYGVYIIPGNHELPGHAYTRVGESSIGILLKCFHLIPQIDGIQDAQPFGMDKDTDAPVVFTHQLVFKDEASRPPMAKGKTASELLDQFPSAQWIFSGDYHHRFHHTERDSEASQDGTRSYTRHVVNPGCMIIHAADMIGQKAYCALVDIDKESVEWIEIPDDPANLSNEHLTSVVERESRVEAYLEKVKSAGSAKILEFKGALELEMQKMEPEDPVHKALVRIRDKATTEEK